MEHSDRRPGRAAIVTAVLLTWAAFGPRSASAITEQSDAGVAREVEQAPAAAAEQPAPAPPQPAPPPELAPVIEPIPTEPGSWRPPARAPDPKRAKDWVLLKSGEILFGEIEHIRDEDVYFDSDELEDLKIDWSDIAGFGSPKLNTYRFGDKEIVTGTAGMRGGVIRVDTGTEIREFRRAELYSMIEGETRELNYWSLNARAGLTWRSGNADQTDLSSQVKLERETALTRGFVAWESAYSMVEDDEVTNNRRITGLFAYYITTRFFLAAPIGELYTDEVRNIDLRATIAAGAGYDVIDRPRVEWSVLGGAGYQRTEYSRLEVGEDDRAQDAALIFQTTLELDPFRDVDWDTSYTLVAVVSDWNKTSHHLTSTFSFEVWGPLDLDVSFVWDRIEKPAPDPDGDTPESDDLQLTVGVKLEL